MPHLASIVLIVRCIAISIVGLTSAHADNRSERTSPRAAARTLNLDLRHPVALLTQALATLIGRDVEPSALGDGNAAKSQEHPLDVAFASDPAHRKLSLLLAQSQVQLRLARDLRLRCELSSLDQANTDPELKVDVGVQFKFE